MTRSLLCQPRSRPIFCDRFASIITPIIISHVIAKGKAVSLSLYPSSLKVSVVGTGCGWLVVGSRVAFRLEWIIWKCHFAPDRIRCFALAGSEQLFAITDNSLRKSDWLSDDNDTSSSSPWSITWTSSFILYRDLSISSSHPFSRHLFTHSLLVSQIWEKEITKLRESSLVPET